MPRLRHDPGVLDLLEGRDLGQVDQVAERHGVGPMRSPAYWLTLKLPSG
jgi:hypothetical protein